jgi:ribonuclease P protein component
MYPPVEVGAPKLGRGCGKVNRGWQTQAFGGFSTWWNGRALTLSPRTDYLFKLVSKRMTPMDRACPDEADVQAPQPQEGQQARVPRQDEDAGRPRHAVASTEERSRAARSEGGRQVDPRHPERRERLPQLFRIRSSNDIRALLERGKRKRTILVEVFFAPSPAGFSRLGLIVPKHGRRIVERNLLKRRLREIARRHVLPALHECGASVDLLVRARREAYEAGFEDLSDALRNATEELCPDVF